MSRVRAKFVCESVENFTENKVAKLRAVYGTTEENADFTKFTPSGTLEICISNDAPASDKFVPGKNYYIDFTETE